MDRDDELLAAIREGDDLRVRALLAAGASPEAIEADTGMIALAVAADEGLTAVVRALLDAGAHPDAAGRDGSRPLVHAVGDERLEILRALLEAGADPNRRDADREPVLYLAAADPDAVALLLRHGADPNAATAEEETPLSFCASWGYLASIRLLLAGGADPNHVMRDGEGGSETMSVLCWAALAGDVAVVEALIAGGADPTWCNWWGRTAASVALEHGHAAAAAAILDLAGVRGEGFTAPVDGLRGRLRISGDRPLQVVLELQCVGDRPVDVTIDDPDAVRWVLERDGEPVAPVFSRCDVMSAPRRVTLAPGDLVRWTVSHRAAEGEGGGPVDLDLVTAAWRLDPDRGRLRLLGTWRGSGEGCWSGTLDVAAALHG